MGNIRQRDGRLFFDFRVRGIRCREQTALADTPANRKRMQKVLDKIEQAIVEGSFDYAAFFPGSKMAARFAQGGPTAHAAPAPALNDHAPPASASDTPLFADFLDDWYRLMLPAWRTSHANTVGSMIRLHLKHHLGQIPVDRITKADILQMRVELAKRKGRAGNTTMSAKSINKVIQLLRQALADAAERYGFTNPALHVKRLKQKRVDIQPFSLAETRALIDAVRPDYRPYMIVRLLTGMRTGEIHGLKWKFVDFDRRQILIRETVIRGRTEYTKTAPTSWQRLAAPSCWPGSSALVSFEIAAQHHELRLRKRVARLLHGESATQHEIQGFSPGGHHAGQCLRLAAMDQVAGDLGPIAFESVHGRCDHLLRQTMQIGQFGTDVGRAVAAAGARTQQRFGKTRIALPAFARQPVHHRLRVNGRHATLNQFAFQLGPRVLAAGQQPERTLGWRRIGSRRAPTPGSDVLVGPWRRMVHSPSSRVASCGTNFSRRIASSLATISGFSLKNWRAFSLPCPIL